MRVLSQQALDDIQILEAVSRLALEHHILDDGRDDLRCDLLPTHSQRYDRKYLLDECIELLYLPTCRRFVINFVEADASLVEQKRLKVEMC